MKLTYIYHSGFAIEGDGFTIIIDYYKDSDDNKSKGIVYSELLKREGKLYVLSTHSHHDHFNKEILKWQQERPDIIYIFSKDIYINQKAADDAGIYMNKLDTYKDSTLSVQLFGSTDLGGSFLIRTKDKTIFHAGDLNNWHWNEESTPEEIKEAEDFYSRELNPLADNVKHLNLAMFPIDKRLGKDYMKGAEQFVKTIKTDIFVPMHFSENGYESIAPFAPIAESYDTKYICWSHRGESIEF
ncbi:L-ascorbate metabolism protein UlaG (beta-lactamase superfamily) [Dysgonomonas sp. PFB1-18]|uniref:MBL fold metallo-hydrolase n=1 Tax=unclassified Dysgonomonas TaxID=2630389 RepID=UPI00247600D2|nr:MULTISPECIES: MBL fold metallo-hydrolase [unclassified Dysgonomonas]MDH6309673.1 L-ascorbate metabolism protein UlaG (beta-lactamase superfamily) [Dysgonomonas sp. PF1-14]MDH6339319.1 L-ascorbate metabolism protein UlaG (beta-lactamase superfamily) [Dysgonomonas sp. PF1-16]MDH6380818.1 L-ascorbate metabolism protein UlaG (beta-lactamase superfamily) [Dysgonomonas sp. PFB1-18]MDH6398314.1 L-ascorbate metabolism protein UlaG (beta-lactamase superfamily) [Dysgonomonas sp. PF1-23]